MKVIAFSDVHGNYELWTKIKNYYKKDDVLIFLGDACDRGPDGIKIMQEMFKDNRIIYLLGNHEQMLLDYIEQGVEESLFRDSDLITYNGCYDTLNAYIKLPDNEKNELVNNLKQKTKFSYIYINKDKKNIFLSHAGTDLNNINTTDKQLLLWDRKHLQQDKIWNNKYKYWYIVHGHTPVQAINKELIIPEIIRYNNNHKINIDMGSFNSNIIVALDLDTLQPKYFKNSLKEDINDNRNNE